MIYLIFSEGFVDHLVDCEETVPQDWEDQSIAGLPLMGSKCYLKCKLAEQRYIVTVS